MLLTGVLGGRESGLRRFSFGVAFLWVLFLLGGGQCSGQGVAAQQPAGAAPAAAGDFSAAGIGTGTRAITGLWQFHLGDDPAWAQPGFDDHGWERLPADQPWGDAGHPRIWGYAWYRREITLDPKSKEPLALLLPPLDSAAEVYWNGVKIGSEGAMPPHPSWFFMQQPVALPLPPPAGASTGVLAIRIWACYREQADPPDASGLQGPVLLGYRPVIQKMPQSWAEHRQSIGLVSNVATLLCVFVGIAALVPGPKSAHSGLCYGWGCFSEALESHRSCNCTFTHCLLCGSM